MFRGTKKLELLAGLSAMLMLVLSVGVAHGGGRWSGIDPELMVNGEKFNIYIEWPEEDTCLIDGLIDVDVWYPKGTNAELIFESESEFPCDTADGGFIPTLTKTSLKDGTDQDPNQGGIMVSAKVNTSVQMPVTVKVYHNTTLVDGKPTGEPIQVCEGFSDAFVFCAPLPFDSGGNGTTNNASNNDEEDEEDEED